MERIYLYAALLFYCSIGHCQIDETKALFLAEGMAMCSALDSSIADKFEVIEPDKSKYIREVSKGFEIASIYLLRFTQYEDNYFKVVFNEYLSRFKALDFNSDEISTKTRECIILGDLQKDIIEDLRKEAYSR